MRHSSPSPSAVSAGLSPSPTAAATPAVQLKASLRGAPLAQQVQMLTPRAPVQKRRAIQKSEPNQSTPDGGVSDGNACFAPPEQSTAPAQSSAAGQSPGAEQSSAQQSSGPAAPGPATTPGGGAAQPATAPGQGGATVFAEAEDTESGYTDRGTPEILRLLRANPNASIDSIIRALGDRSFSAPGSTQPNFNQVRQNFTVASYGQPRGGQSAPTAKNAVLIANSVFTPGLGLCNLPGVAPQAQSMQSELNGRGFTTNLVANAQAAAIGQQWSAMVNAAAPGSELVAFYTGHGSRQGIYGAEGALHPHGAIMGLIGNATARGAHIEVMLDACHTGTLASMVHERHANQPPSRGGIGGITASRWSSLARSAIELKQHFIALSDKRHQTLDQLDAALARATTPPIIMARVSIDALRDAIPRARQAYAAKADALLEEARGAYAFAIMAVNFFRGTHLSPPDAISDYDRYGNVLQFLDRLTNEALALAAGEERPEQVPNP